jgi:hypothetical protein
VREPACGAAARFRFWDCSRRFIAARLDGDVVGVEVVGVMSKSSSKELSCGFIPKDMLTPPEQVD